MNGVGVAIFTGLVETVPPVPKDLFAKRAYGPIQGHELNSLLLPTMWMKGGVRRRDRDDVRKIARMTKCKTTGQVLEGTSRDQV